VRGLSGLSSVINAPHPALRATFSPQMGRRGKSQHALNVLLEWGRSDVSASRPTIRRRVAGLRLDPESVLPANSFQDIRARNILGVKRPSLIPFPFMNALALPAYFPQYGGELDIDIQIVEISTSLI